MREWSDAPIEKAIILISHAGGQLIIHNDLLAVLISEEKVQELNEKLVTLGWTDGRKGVELGLPEKIDPHFKKEKKSELWRQYYGDMPQINL